jgi:hypothetical protein
MEALFSIVLVLLGVIVLLVYALLFFGKHGVLTGTDDEKEGEEDEENN